MSALGDEFMSRGSPKACALKHLFDADYAKSLNRTGFHGGQFS
jgi:hypothetical protein